MAPINGRPFLEHLLDYWINQGVRRFVLSLGYKHEVIIDHFGNKYKSAKIEYVIETTPLGTGGSAFSTIQKLDIKTPFLLLNGDTYFAIDLEKLIEFATLNNADWCFSLFCNQNSDRYMGLEVNEDGRIASLKSSHNMSDNFVNGGVYWVNPENILIEKYTFGENFSLENDFFKAALCSGINLCGKIFNGTFIDIGVPDDYYRASTLTEFK